MKNYFGFNLTGKEFFPIWIIFYLILIVPYVILTIKIQNIPPAEVPSLTIFICLFLLILVAFFISFYLTRISIENITYKDTQITFNGKFRQFVGLVLKGILLSIITLFVYAAWFVKDIYRFFVNDSSYKNEPFVFQGKGKDLFLIIIVTLLIPIIVLTIIMARIFTLTPGEVSTSYMIINQIVIWLICIPYMYSFYKWMINIDFKNYKIRWETELVPSCKKIALEILLSIITIGIYFPMAMIKLYAYFAERTIAQSGDVKRRFGFETDYVNDFKFIWGQMLLTIITIGIYAPWAISKIGTRILKRTYIE
jgi:uncharacterized membrane protein YjgN (DUF898 family)